MDPQDDRAGDPVGALASRFQELESRFRSLVENTSDWVWEVDETGRYVYSSPKVQDLLGRDPSEILGRTPMDLMPPDEAERVGRIFREILREHRSFQDLENWNLHRDGTPVLLETSGVPIHDREGRFRGYRGIDRDATGRHRDAEARAARERRQLESERHESLGILAGGFAHDFNNLLTTILGYACLGLEEVPPGSRLAEVLDRVRTAAEQAAALTSQLLAYSGRRPLVVEPADLNALIADVAEEQRKGLRPGLRIEVRPAPSLPAVEADRTQLRQALRNLVVNAVEALADAPEGTVTLSTAAVDVGPSEPAAGWAGRGPSPGCYASVAVEDTGPGLPEALVGRIFEPFYSTRFMGRGLGLPVVLGIVRGHDGCIRVDTRPGHGSRFTFLLPAGPHPLRGAAEPPIVRE